jgi:hypothetical protein
MKKAILLMMAVSLLCFAGIGSALADALQLVGTPSGQEFGVYTTPYTISVNGISTPLICDDFSTEISMYQSWTATATNGSALTTTAGLNAVKFGSNGTPDIGLQGYEEMFYLADQLEASPMASPQSEAISWAIWAIGAGNLTTSSASLPDFGSAFGVKSIFWATTNNTADGGYWIAQAEKQTNYGNVVLSDFTVYTPVQTSVAQEFIGVRVPEPSVLVFLGVSLLGACVAARRRFRRI